MEICVQFARFLPCSDKFLNCKTDCVRFLAAVNAVYEKVCGLPSSNLLELRSTKHFFNQNLELYIAETV